jgi:hypothetical protein
MLKIMRYYDSEEEFQRFYYTLKQVRCPHCRQEGTLILHGYLYGYSEQGDTNLIVRGRRLFCSNRHRRSGCGRTVSVLASAFLRGFIITAAALWCFLIHAAASRHKRAAFARLGLALCPSGAYRLFRRVRHAQSRIRMLLLRRTPAPAPPPTPHPISATLAHLQAAFPEAPCPIAAFQHAFQAAFL